MKLPAAWIYGTPLHVDPSAFSLEQLARIRGAMWTCRANLPYGPRPGDDDNIIATDFFSAYTPDQQATAIAVLKSKGYTHVVVGPIVDSDGYHGLYPAHDWRDHFDDFLDVLQQFWDAGLPPICFIHPDNWTLEQTQALTALFLTPRAQRLMRIVVPAGWEPTRYGWSSVTWALFGAWARAVWPTALILLHTVADTDAPAGTDDRFNDDDLKANPTGNAGAWTRVAPYFHGWLIQNGPYTTAPTGNPQLAQNFGDQFRASVPHSIAWHFAGNAGWPVGSAWGPTVRIKLYNAECTSFEAVWHNLSEGASQDWGDLAIAAGADGYLDSGRVAVP